MNSMSFLTDLGLVTKFIPFVAGAAIAGYLVLGLSPLVVFIASQALFGLAIILLAHGQTVSIAYIGLFFLYLLLNKEDDLEEADFFSGILKGIPMLEALAFAYLAITNYLNVGSSNNHGMMFVAIIVALFGFSSYNTKSKGLGCTIIWATLIYAGHHLHTIGKLDLSLATLVMCASIMMPIRLNVFNGKKVSPAEQTKFAGVHAVNQTAVEAGSELEAAYARIKELEKQVAQANFASKKPAPANGKTQYNQVNASYRAPQQKVAPVVKPQQQAAQQNAAQKEQDMNNVLLRDAIDNNIAFNDSIIYE